MKILCIHPDSRIEAGADSAILRHGEPVFPSDLDCGWKSVLVPAIRISRLGTSVRKTRAREYYDSFTLFHVLWPACGSEVAPGIPAAVADRTFAPGLWLPLPGSDADVTGSVRALRDGEGTPFNCRINLPSLDTDAVIARLSQQMTFKTGDKLLFFNSGIELGPAAIDTEIKASVNGTEVLSFRIK